MKTCILYFIFVMNLDHCLFLLISVKKKKSHIKSTLIQCCKTIKREIFQVGRVLFTSTVCLAKNVEMTG